MNKHRIILDDYQTGIIETNEKGEITWANSTYLEFTNRDLREVIGNGWVNAIHPEDREKVYAEWQNALEQARNFEAAFRVVKQDGSIVHVQGHAFPIKGRERIQGYIGKIKIVMENKQHA
jgi:PAS domain S-box-containing protein